MLSRLLVAPALAALALAGSSCSYGVVVDKETQQPLGGARVTAHAVTVRRTVRGGVLALSTASQSAVTWDATAPGGTEAAGHWYLNPYGTTDEALRASLRIPEGLIRFTVSRTGYDTRTFFRNHHYAPCSVASGANPVSGGSYPVDLNAAQQPGTCARASFALSPSDQNYVKDPDIVVDPRMLLDYVFVSTRGTPPRPSDMNSVTCEGRADRCLRVSVATANVGAGDLWLTAPRGEQENVTQHRYRRNSGMVDTPLNARFVSDTHPHLHLDGWTLMRLRKIDARCETPLTAEQCPVVDTGTKISFCLRDSANFDTNGNAAAGVYRPNRTYDCVANATTISQGVSSGRMDIYAKDLVGQMIPIDGLHGDYWLEAEVNPQGPDGQRIAIESDYSNNVSRVRLTLP